MLIRKIKKEDNVPIAKVIRDVFIELDAPKTGTAYEDPILDTLFEVYEKDKSVYYVIEHEGKIIGGSGIAPLENGSKETCELQKMYFAPEARGKGLGLEMILKCLDFAKEAGFKSCYLETLEMMKDAQKLYQKVGFEYLEEPLGCTGHTSCPVWMMKDL
ncbi:GNAT family N-acetyltransferase [uncultured Flavobacterium sp.]|uniref:GNAT family N-acetyltransferase n=1 Tax=uncultured Flavobacterium sp. TaxID=165435 RepID=UPI0030C7B34C